MERKTLHLSDLHGHGTPRVFVDVVSSIMETGGIIAERLATKTEPGIELVSLSYDVKHNAFILKAKDERGAAWENKAAYGQGREELAALDFIREVFEAEGRD